MDESMFFDGGVYVAYLGLTLDFKNYIYIFNYYISMFKLSRES